LCPGRIALGFRKRHELQIGIEPLGRQILKQRLEHALVNGMRVGQRNLHLLLDGVGIFE